ncbi:la-related protein 6A isoform X1 [Spinacia oleracea]|uniref:La-related protein 6A isoform X1 n=1 Tax=Spinacia oleracea TaxID=3562 RepID=A0A9R0K165_SPIOL|nr:la-related protein 6A isoform X1 [Spinacia oleracea]
MDGGDAIPSHSPEISAVETATNEDTILHSPPLSGDDDDHRPPPAASSDSDLRAKIAKQVEYYFSDENLPSDKFLLKQVKKDKEGFVSISLIGSFRKMKKLTKDSSSIVDALKESRQLILSSDGKKVKRRNPLPSNEDAELCVVVVANLPEDHSVQNIQKICGRAGSIKTISIHDPHAAEDSAKRNKAEKLVNGKMYALVEYDTVEAAEKAVVTLNDEMDWRNGLRVQLLQKQRGSSLGRKTWRESDSEKGGRAQMSVSAKDDNNNHSNEQRDDEDGEHRSKEGNGRKGRNRSKGQKYRGNNGLGHGRANVVESSNKQPPGPRMPDGTRGFSMGRGQPPMSSHSN